MRQLRNVKPKRKSSCRPFIEAAILAQERVFTVEMHHQRGAFASTSDKIGLIIKGLHRCQQVACDTAACKETHFDDAANEMKSMLVGLGSEYDFIQENKLMLPLS